MAAKRVAGVTPLRCRRAAGAPDTGVAGTCVQPGGSCAWFAVYAGSAVVHGSRDAGGSGAEPVPAALQNDVGSAGADPAGIGWAAVVSLGWLTGCGRDHRGDAAGAGAATAG